MLAAQQAALRAADVPELVEALGWCSTFRDLREDLGAGIVNVPREVLLAAGIRTAPAIDADELLAAPPMRAWMMSERALALARLDATDARLRALRGRSGARALGVFARSVRNFASVRFAKRFPTLENPCSRSHRSA